jgi:hypothetical protein
MEASRPLCAFLYLCIHQEIFFSVVFSIYIDYCRVQFCSLLTFTKRMKLWKPSEVKQH